MVRSTAVAILVKCRVMGILWELRLPGHGNTAGEGQRTDGGATMNNSPRLSKPSYTLNSARRNAVVARNDHLVALHASHSLPFARQRSRNNGARDSAERRSDKRFGSDDAGEFKAEASSGANSPGSPGSPAPDSSRRHRHR